MMKKVYYQTVMLAAGLFFIILSCVEEKTGQTPVDSIPPPPLSDVQVEPRPGGAKITYELPNETDMSYVKGEFMFQGKKRVVRSSVYDNFLMVEGLGSADPVTITLYLVDLSENVSEPVSRTFTPDTPPIQSILQSMSLSEDFGGINAKWDNPLAIEIALTVLATDSTETLVEGETTFSKTIEGNYSFRGYDDSPRLFAVYITDKWGNVSDTVEKLVTPYFEILLDKSKHREGRLPGDNTSLFSSSMAFSAMFDGNTQNFWHTAEGGHSFVMPQYFTIDLGDTARLSRFIMWERQGIFNYAHHNPRTFAIWATLEYTLHPDIYWQEEWKLDWEFLGDFEVIKPSGPGAVTDIDIAAAEAGFQFYFPPMEKARYLRFMIKNTWSSSNTIHINELSFYGDNKKDE